MSKQIIWDTKAVIDAAEKMNNGFVLSKLDCPFYEKTIGLRRAGIIFKMTDDERNEYIKCALDIQYFAQKYCFVKGEDGQPAIIKLRDYQEEILDNFMNNRFNILMASRQVGKCFSYNSIVEIMIGDESFKIRIGTLYYMMLSKHRKLTILEEIKIRIWNMIYLIENNFQIERKPLSYDI